MENLLHLETMQATSVVDPFTLFQDLAIEEGYKLGELKGFAVGKEIGFYWGAAESWIEEITANPDLYPARALKMLQNIVALVEAFPRENDKDFDMEAAITRLRAKFKAVTSVLGVPTQRDAIKDLVEKGKYNF
ncbi:hypothetical protein HDU96_004800 [Phlyctochytrium bullatum]|nr:hypothetical protein HDU96_004800 [Phlyctochytrium bullatum]